MRSLMHVQEAVLGMLYIQTADGCNVTACLQWMFDLGCTYELRVHHQLICCPTLHMLHKQIVCLSAQNRSFCRCDCIDATVMTV